MQKAGALKMNVLVSLYTSLISYAYAGKTEAAEKLTDKAFMQPLKMLVP